MRPLYDLQPAQPRNARLWDGSAGTGAITVPSEIRNAATLDDARRLAGMNPHLPHREDVRAAFVAGRELRERADGLPADGRGPDAEALERREVMARAFARGDDAETIREAWPSHWPRDDDGNRRWMADRKWVTRQSAPVAAPKETTMAKKRGPTETQTTPTPDKLRTHLLLNGPTTRDELRVAVGYAAHYPSEAVARTMLNKHLRELGAVSPQGRLGPVELPGAASETQPAAPKKTRAERDHELDAPARRRVAEALAATRGEHTDPVRPSLARAAREAIREANESDAPVYLEPAFAKALHRMLVEAGL